MKTNDPIYPIYENIATAETKMHWALDNPSLYTVKELQQIQEEYEAASKAMDDYLRADFRSLLANDTSNTLDFRLEILQPSA